MANRSPWIQARWALGFALAAGVMGMGIPLKQGPDADAQDLALQLLCAELNAASEAFRRDHGHWPGLQVGPVIEPQPDAELLRQDLLGRRAPGAAPYLSSWPAHPNTGSASVRVLDGRIRASQDGQEPGWIWRPELGQIRPDPAALRASGSPSSPTQPSATQTP